jgi:hypothetical protein
MRALAIATGLFLLASSAGCGDGASRRSGYVYWVSYDGGLARTVNEVSADGGHVTALASDPDVPKSVRSVVVDGSHVYWVDEGAVKEVPLDGGRVTTLVSGQATPVSVAVDKRHVYWLNSGVGNFTGTVNEAPLDGGHVTTLARGQELPRSLAVDGSHVYWVDGGGCDVCGIVEKVPIGGGRVTTLADGVNTPISVAVSGGHVYWIGRLLGTVNEVPVGGGRVTALARGQNGPVSLAVNGTHVYWVNYYDGTVNEIPLDGGTITTLARGQSYPSAVAVNGSDVYWVDEGLGSDGTVNEVPLGGGRVTTLASGQNGAGSVAVAPSHARVVRPEGAARPAGMIGPTRRVAMIGSIGDGPTGEFGPTGDYEAYNSNQHTDVPRIGPILLSATGLAAEGRLIGQRIYWAGPKRGFSYEFTRDTAGNIYVAYLPQGARDGAPGQFLIVGTYPFISAYDTLVQWHGGVAHGPGRSLVYTKPDHPNNALIAFRGDCPKSKWAQGCGLPYEIEVHDPAVSARVALQSGQVTVKPVG